MPVVDAGTDFINCENDPIVLDATGAVTYVWDNGVTQGVSFIPTSTVTYHVIGTDGNGCTGLDSITVTFEPTPQPSFSKLSTSRGKATQTIQWVRKSIGVFSTLTAHPSK